MISLSYILRKLSIRSAQINYSNSKTKLVFELIFNASDLSKSEGEKS